MATINAKGMVNFGELLAEILGEYTEKVDKAIEEGADEAAAIFIKHAAAVSPVKTGEYRNSWTTNESKGRYKRYVGNAKTVAGKKGAVPLINILEYSTVRGNPHVKKAVNESKSEILACYVKRLNKGA